MKLGMDGKLYYLSAKLTATPTTADSWTEITNAKDVTLNLSTGTADGTTRANNGWKAQLAILREGSIDFTMNWEEDDTAFQAVRDAYLNGDMVAMAVMSEDVATGEGLAANFMVTNFTRNEPIEDVMTASVTVVPSEYIAWLST